MLWHTSWANFVLDLASIPVYEPEEEKEKKGAKDANDFWAG